MFSTRKPIMYFYICKFESSCGTCDTSASNFCRDGIFGYFQEESTSGMHDPSTCEHERVQCGFGTLFLKLWTNESIVMRAQAGIHMQQDQPFPFHYIPIYQNHSQK